MKHWYSEIGREISGHYGVGDLEGDSRARIGEPGEFPFTRHIHVSGNRDRPWAPSLYSGFGSAEDTNRRFRFLIQAGNGRANIAADLPTQIGLDSDDPLASGEVGRLGVAIDSLEDFETMFEGVPLDTTPVSMNINSTAPIFLAMLIATAKRQGVDPRKITGTLSNDILHEYVARGTWRYEPSSSLRLMADTAEYAIKNTDAFYPFNIRSILLHESGAHPGQEIGFTFAMACRYVDELIGRGIDIDAAAPRVSFFFGMGLHLLQEVAKFRAARRLWANLIRERYKTDSPSSLKLRVTTVAPCGSHFTAADPELNLVRGTIGVLAGALGGVQAMLGTSLDEAFEIPTEKTQKLALRTQQIVALETDVCATADPLGGSYFIEAMTDQIEQSAVDEMALLGGAEGVVAAILDGKPQSLLSDRAYRVEQQFASGERPKVGVNVHISDEPNTSLELHEVDPDLERDRVEALSRLRARRNAAEVEQSLQEVRVAARSNENILPATIRAVEAYATIGEISKAMDDVFGLYQQPVSI